MSESTQGPRQEWVSAPLPIRQHDKLMVRRIGSLSDDDLNIKFAVLAERMLDAAATYIGTSPPPKHRPAISDVQTPVDRALGAGSAPGRSNHKGQHGRV
jgi:hypothetical protein